MEKVQKSSISFGDEVDAVLHELYRRLQGQQRVG
jgi:hypothetical protein